MRKFVLTVILAAVPSAAFAAPSCMQREALPVVVAEPTYAQLPAILDSADVHGEAQVVVRLSPELSRPVDVSLFRSSGSEILDMAAIRAAKLTQFTPEKRDCVAVSGAYIYTFVY